MTNRTSQQEDDIPFLDEFLMDADLQGLQDTTVELYNSNLRTFFGWVDSEPQSIDHQDLIVVLDEIAGK